MRPTQNQRLSSSTVTVVRSRLGILLPLLVAAVLALTGCGDDPEGGDADPTGPTSQPTGASPTPPTTADPTETGEPSASSSSTVAPATGDLLELPNVSVRAPKGFRADPPDLTYLRFAFERDGIQSIALANTPALVQDVPLRDQAEISIRNSAYSEQPKIQKPVEIGGVTMYHYGGRVNENEYVEEYGAIYDGSQVSVNFLLAATASAAERQQLVDSVMATLTLS